MLNLQPRSVLKSKKLEFDGFLEDNEILNSESAEDSSHPNNTDHLIVLTNVSAIASLRTAYFSIISRVPTLFFFKKRYM